MTDKDALLRDATADFEMWFKQHYPMFGRTSPSGFRDTSSKHAMKAAYLAGATRITAALEGGKDGGCEWVDEGEYWQTGCGQAFCIGDGTPQQNDMKFCCFCGDKIPPLPTGDRHD